MRVIFVVCLLIMCFGFCFVSFALCVCFVFDVSVLLLLVLLLSLLCSVLLRVYVQCFVSFVSLCFCLIV